MRVLCTRPNASDEISGVRFEKHEGGMVSVDIGDEQAAAFLEVGGYELVGDSGPDTAAVQAQADADAAAAAEREKAKHKEAADAAAKLQAEADAEAQRQAEAAAAANPPPPPAPSQAELDAGALAAAVAEAKGLGIDVKGNWKLARVTAEIGRAKASKTA